MGCNAQKETVIDVVEVGPSGRETGDASETGTVLKEVGYRASRHDCG
jgi:hypothetical protein